MVIIYIGANMLVESLKSKRQRCAQHTWRLRMMMKAKMKTHLKSRGERNGNASGICVSSVLASDQNCIAAVSYYLLCASPNAAPWTVQPHSQQCRECQLNRLAKEIEGCLISLMAFACSNFSTKISFALPHDPMLFAKKDKSWLNLKQYFSSCEGERRRLGNGSGQRNVQSENSLR